jgi:hypothetical protein
MVKCLSVACGSGNTCKFYPILVFLIRSQQQSLESWYSKRNIIIKHPVLRGPAYTGARYAGRRNNWPLNPPHQSLHLRGSLDKIVTCYLSLGTHGNVPTASMPAGARSHCIMVSKDLEIFAFVFVLCRWSADSFKFGLAGPSFCFRNFSLKVRNFESFEFESFLTNVSWKVPTKIAG